MEAYCAASATREGRRAMQAHPESMLAEKTGSDPAKITPKLVTDCAKAGDPAATAVFRRLYRAPELRLRVDL